MKIIDGHRLRSRVEYECPRCLGRLERRVTRGDRLLVLISSVGLGGSSLLMLLEQLYLLSAAQARPAIMLLGLLGIVAIALELRNEFVRVRFFAPDETPRES